MNKENKYFRETIIKIEKDKYHICGDDWYGYYTKKQLKKWYLDVKARIKELLKDEE